MANRDELAQAALTGVLSNPETMKRIKVVVDSENKDRPKIKQLKMPQVIAQYCYEVADAMIVESHKKK
jgi:hypothetical protein